MYNSSYFNVGFFGGIMNSIVEYTHYNSLCWNNFAYNNMFNFNYTSQMNNLINPFNTFFQTINSQAQNNSNYDILQPNSYTPNSNYISYSFDTPYFNTSPRTQQNINSLFTAPDFSYKSQTLENSNNYWGDTLQLTYTQAKTHTKDFDSMLNFVLGVEGGEKAHITKGDRGGLTKKGVTQATYNSYRKNKNLSQQKVSEMTDTEMREIYYEMFYKESGADKIQDPKLALYVFDTAVNMGPAKAKQLLQKSQNNPEKLLSLRLASYKEIAKNSENQKRFLDGWTNRLNNLKDFGNQLA